VTVELRTFMCESRRDATIRPSCRYCPDPGSQDWYSKLSCWPWRLGWSGCSGS